MGLSFGKYVDLDFGMRATALEIQHCHYCKRVQNCQSCIRETKAVMNIGPSPYLLDKTRVDELVRWACRRNVTLDPFIV